MWLEDHKATRPEEKKRVQMAGGSVSSNGRVIVVLNQEEKVPDAPEDGARLDVPGE